MNATNLSGCAFDRWFTDRQISDSILEPHEPSLQAVITVSKAQTQVG